MFFSEQIEETVMNQGLKCWEEQPLSAGDGKPSSILVVFPSLRSGSPRTSRVPGEISDRPWAPGHSPDPFPHFSLLFFCFLDIPAAPLWSGHSPLNFATFIIFLHLPPGLACHHSITFNRIFPPTTCRALCQRGGTCKQLWSSSSDQGGRGGLRKMIV